ncbi:MAG: hypothetical protein AB1499_08535, partial [Nitrospirota bacterium]
AQRLVRKICNHCKIEVAVPEEIPSMFTFPLRTSFKGTGCSKCNYTGYSGRVGIYELLKMDVQIKRMIAKKFTEEDLWECARNIGTKTLFEDAISKVEEGVTTVEEIISKIPYQQFLQKEIQPAQGTKKNRKTPRASEIITPS